jgi:virginiamycin B lyase
MVIAGDANAGDWSTTYAQFLSRSAALSAKTMGLYQLVLERIAQGKLAATVFQDRLPSFIVVHGARFTNQLSEVVSRFLGALINLGMGMSRRPDGPLPLHEEAPLIPPQLDPSNPARWYEQLAEFAGQLNARAIKTYRTTAACNCKLSNAAQAPEETASVVAEVRLAPADARCIVIKSVGSTTVTQSFDVQPSSTTVLALKGVPTGTVTITANAYNLMCASIVGTSVATYVADPVTLTVTLSQPVSVVFQMRLNTGGGSGGATVEFPMRAQTTETLSSANGAMGITSGADGNLWISERTTNHITKLTPALVPTSFTVPTASAGLYGITVGSDGNVWFAETTAGKIGRITPTGTIVEFTVGGGPRNVTAGPDGNIWFTDNGAKIGRITPLGVATSFTVAAGSTVDIVTASDGNLWFTGTGPNLVGRITPTGTITTWAQTFIPGAITATQDAKVYVVAVGLAVVAQGTTAGFSTSMGLVTNVTDIQDLTVGPDGAAWFIGAGGTVGRVSPFDVWSTPRTAPGGTAITLGPDGALWFTMSNSSVGGVGRLLP